MAEPARLSFERELLVDVAASLASRRDTSLRRALGVASRVCAPADVEEVLLQSHLFVGFPLVLEAFFTWRSIHHETEGQWSEGEPEAWADRGAEVCGRVYAGMYGRLRANVSSLHPDLDRWMVEVGYGRVLGRPALDLATRELCIAAQLAVWDAPRQLFSHARGAINSGATPAELDAAIEVACRHLDPARSEAVRDAVRRALRV